MGFDKEHLKVDTSDGLNVVLDEELTFTAADGQKYVVPRGTYSDGASVPRVLWRLFPPFGKYWRAALLHDHLYGESKLPKEKCDALFYEAMRACGVSWIKAKTIYQGVNLFGGWAFNKCRKAQGGNK